MAAFTIHDVLAAARALAYADPRDQSRLLREMARAAHEADAFRLTHGAFHASLGNGTLEAVARKRTLASIDFTHAKFCRAMASVLLWRASVLDQLES